MSTITIIEGNNNDKDNIRVLMVKGETGATISTIAKTGTSGLVDTYTVTLSDGRTQTFTVTNGKSITSIEKTGTSGLVDTYTITYNDNTTQTFTVTNGYSPSANVSKSNGVTTVTITDKDGTTTAEINDAVGYEVPTGAIIGWNTTKVSYSCDGTETGGYYLVSNTLSYYFTMPTIEAGDLLIFDPTDESLTLNGETIVTTSSGTGTELTFTDYIPAGYEDTGDTFGGGNPTGVVLEFAGATAPAGYLLCDGSAVSRTTYASLFNVIGTAYGAGDGSTTFNIPNCKGRVVVGYNSSDTAFDSLGETGGEKTHILTTDEMPAHSHILYTSNQTGSQTDGYFHNGSYTKTSEINRTRNEGGNQAHNNLQPYIVMNYIIKY